MVSKTLAALLISAAMLGQASLSATLSAQADTQIPLYFGMKPSNTTTPNLELASFIPHTTIDALPGEDQEDIHHPSTPDIYTIGGGAGKLPTLIQVLPQTGNVTSLFVNGSEILRFHGTVAQMDSYKRVKAIADRLNRTLTTESASVNSLHPQVKSASKNAASQAFISLGGETLATIDAVTAKAVQETPEKLALLYSNRLRQALGVTPMSDQDTKAYVANSSKPQYQGTGRTLTGMASWYGGRFNGRRAADGSRFNMNAMTAAHKTLPFGTMVKVINQRNQKSCLVKITDRGPYAHGRIIDLSRGAATALGMLGSGVTRVSVEIVKHSG